MELDINLVLNSPIDHEALGVDYTEKVARLASDVTLIHMMRKYIAVQLRILIAGESERTRGRIEGVVDLMEMLVAAEAESKHGLNQETLDTETIPGPIGSAPVLVEGS